MVFVPSSISATSQATIFSKILIYVQAAFQYFSSNGLLIDSLQFGLYYLLYLYLAFKNKVYTNYDELKKFVVEKAQVRASYTNP